VGQYSKGMARRIGLAQSLINDPDLLILDEPTSGLDPIGTRQIKDLLLELKKRGKTILLSSHLLADVEDVCDRVAIMYGGKLLCCGRIDQLLAQQEMTQILTENLDSEQLKKLAGYLEENLGSKVISVGSPRDRLEKFFLRMIHQASKEMQTSGALAGGKVSEFLRSTEEDTGSDLLQKLTSEEPVKPIPSDSTPKETGPRTEEVQKSVLNQLTSDVEPEPQKSSTPQAKIKTHQPAKAPEVDRNLLDGLMNDADEQKKAGG